MRPALHLQADQVPSAQERTANAHQAVCAQNIQIWHARVLIDAERIPAPIGGFVRGRDLGFDYTGDRPDPQVWQCACAARMGTSSVAVTRQRFTLAKAEPAKRRPATQTYLIAAPMRATVVERACGPGPLTRPCHVIIADRRAVDGLPGRGQCRRPVQRRRSPPGLCIEVRRAA